MIDVRTNHLGTSRLTRALLAGDSTVATWYATPPRSTAAWRDRAKSIALRDEWLTALAPAFDASGEAAARLGRASVLVTTGQQPGFFGGPIYTWSKALSALAMADALEAACGIPVAPVFWAATDDSDQREARSTWIPVPGGATELSMPGRAPDGTIMNAVPVGDASGEIAQLVAATGSAVYPEALTTVAEAYHAGVTAGEAYVELLRRLLEPLGIAVLDAAHETVRAAARPLLSRALERAADIERVLIERSQAIASAGYDPQVADVRGLSLVFAYDGATKKRLRVGDTTRATSLGPNVLLRPVVESAILPTVAYMAGPGELAYFAQVTPVAEALGARPPVVLPRWSCTIVEPHIARLLERRGLDVDDLRDPHTAESRVAREAMPPELGDAIAGLRRLLAHGISQVEKSASSLQVAPTTFQGALRSAGYKIDRLERRLLARVKSSELEAMTELATLRGALYPNNKPQERALNMIPLLARHGPTLFDSMRQAARRHAETLVG
ncbi:MAG TPA: bacillithiol biosynthesis BshC [Gemmatimonadaceae bacterium]|nr:bacillithiol biosynthesis BshC [Gemmatimonadaceae bacterium]